MAVTKITYENKTAIQNDASVARKNKVVDEDMNEIKQVVNGNADELNTAQTNIKKLQSGQGTSSTDISNLKNRVSTLETDDTKNKSDINTLKSDNQTNKSNISTMQGQISEIQQEQKTQNTDIENLQINDNKQDSLISKLKNAALNAETEESKSLHVTDANKFGQLEVLGNQEQDGEPSPENEVPVICLGSNKNLLNLQELEVSNNNGIDTYTIDNSNQITLKNKTTTSGIPYSYSFQAFELNLPAGNYNLSAKVETNSSNYRIIIRGKKDGSNTTSAEVVSQSKDNGNFNIDYSQCDEYTIEFYANQANVEKLVTTKYYDIKIEEGTEGTSYSPYGQGSTLISKINKNFYDKTNAIQRGLWGNNNSNLINTNYVGWYVIVKIIGGKTYTISRKNGEEENSYLQLAGTSTADFPANGVEMLNQWTQDLQNNGKKLQIQTAENANYLLIGLAAGQISEITEEVQTLAMEELMVNIEDNEISYIEHQQEDYLLYIQQEMLQGDYFIKEDDGWKEVHGWNKIILTGNENLIKSGASSSDKLIAVLAISNGIDGFGYSNYFKYSETFGIGNFIVYNNGTNLAFGFDSTEIATLEEAKSFLTEKYNAGNPVYFYYKTATPTKLACTEEQSAVLEKLSNLDLFEGVNNIIAAEDIALLKLKYALDVETYIDNKLNTINQQILNIAGGN